MNTRPKLNTKHLVYFILSLLCIYGFACYVNLINEFFDQSPPEIIQGKVTNRGEEYLPLPTYVLTILPDNTTEEIKVQVLSEIYEAKGINSNITIAKKAGFFSTAWFQHIELYEKLHNGNKIQAYLYLVFFFALAFIAFIFIKKKSNNKVASILTSINVILGFIVFPILP